MNFGNGNSVLFPYRRHGHGPNDIDVLYIYHGSVIDRGVNNSLIRKVGIMEITLN